MAEQINSVKELLHTVADPEKRKKLALPENQNLASFIIPYNNNNNTDKVVIPKEEDIGAEFYANLEGDRTLDKATLLEVTKFLANLDNQGNTAIIERVDSIINKYNKRNGNAKLYFKNNRLTLEGQETGLFQNFKDFCQRNKGTLVTIGSGVALVGLGFAISTLITLAAPGLSTAGVTFIAAPLTIAVAMGAVVIGGKYISKLMASNIDDSLSKRFPEATTDEPGSNSFKETSVKKANVKQGNYGPSNTNKNKEEI